MKRLRLKKKDKTLPCDKIKVCIKDLKFRRCVMTSKQLREKFLKKFDVVGIIHTQDYMVEAKKLNPNIEEVSYETMVVVALSYPKRVIKHTETHLVPSFYTFG